MNEHWEVRKEVPNNNYSQRTAMVSLKPTEFPITNMPKVELSSRNIKVINPLQNNHANSYIPIA